MKARVHRGARRKIKRLTTAWADGYPQPETNDPQLRADAVLWTRSVIDDVFDVAVERSMAGPMWTSMFAMALVITTAAYVRLAPLTLAGSIIVWFFGVVTFIAFVGMTVVSSPMSSRKLRAALASQLIEAAVVGVQRRRAFVLAPPLPASQPDWRTFEKIAIEWMRYLGDVTMHPTPDGADGGIDGVSDRFVMQAKNWQRDLVGVEKVRALHGVSAEQGRRGVFFTRRGYTVSALDFARRTNMPLFLVDVARSRLSPANESAQFLRANGVHVVNEVELA